MELVKFGQALERYKVDIGYTQYWRYRGGKLPRIIRWLAEHPDLARALAEDSVDLAKKKRLQQKQLGATEVPTT